MSCTLNFLELEAMNKKVTRSMRYPFIWYLMNLILILLLIIKIIKYILKSTKLELNQSDIYTYVYIQISQK
jgi:hypothetical protein